MNEVREGAAHKLSRSSPELLQVPQHPNSDYRPEHGPVTEILFYIGLRKIDNWVTGSNSIFELTLSKPHSFFIMTTRTIMSATNPTGIRLRLKLTMLRDKSFLEDRAEVS